MMKRMMSTVLAIILVITSLMGTTMIAQAANYSAFPVCQEEKEDALQTAPELKLNQSYGVSFKNGVYTNPQRTELYSVYEPNKVLKFIPTANGYYEASIYIAERNQHMTVQFAYSDAESIKDNKYYSVSNGSYEYNIHTSKEASIASSTYNVYRNTARGAAYLQKGKTYYIVAYASYDDYDVEKTMKTEVQGYAYHTVPATIKVYKHSHDYEVTTYKYSDYTSAYYNCRVCSHSTSSYFYKPKTLNLSATSYTYDGKVKKPSVTVKDSDGKKISSAYYDVTYSGGCKNVGKYTVKVKFKKEYARFGSMTKTFTINPKGTSVSKVTAAKKGFKVTWKKQTTQTTGYEVQYSTSSNFKKGNKTVTVGKNKTTSKSVSKLSAKKKYYVRVRTYKTVKVNGKNVKFYSGWSKAKSVTTKK